MSALNDELDSSSVAAGADAAGAVPAILKDAFEQFTHASRRLEVRYEELRGETEELKRQLQQKDTEIKRKERLSMLGETAAALAHEVKNPLGAMKLFLSLLARDVSDRPQAYELVQQIDTSVTSLDNLVNNILHFSVDRKLTLAPLNLHALIRDQVDSIRRGAGKNAVIELELNATPLIQGNDHTLKQVFANLLMNALQATAQRGVIHIKSYDGPTGTLEIIVSDNGPGVASTLLERVFEPFVTGRNEGTGLGLAIVQQILTRHNASISVRNRGGAEFRLSFQRDQGLSA